MIIGIAEKILPGGETLVRVDGEAVLVTNAVPGDVVKLQMLAKRRGVQRAEIVEVIEASPERVRAPCPVASECGGCALQFISEENQAAVKSDWVADAFKSLIDSGTKWIQVHPDHGRYRRRVRWFVGHNESETFLGFYAPASHQPVRHSDCMVVSPELNAVRQLIEKNVNLRETDSVQAVQLDDGIHIILEADSCPECNQTDQLGGLPLLWWWCDDKRITRPLKKPARLFHDVLPAGKAEEVRLAIGPDDFVQGQDEGNRELITQIQVWAGSVTRIADLFCGIGNLSLALAAATGARVFGAELNAASVRAASANARELGIFSSFVVANLFEDFDMEPYIGADVLILDPPRRGAKRLCNQMSLLLPKKIIMISCDAAAGRRDGILLLKHGYRLRALRALDMFPYAGHVEAMSLWEQG
ncbi:MAG: methyltransferase [Mariprofundus sp.]|nr:methyltransferase [Mariprofundus sp.]